MGQPRVGHLQVDPLDAAESGRLFAIGGACLALLTAIGVTAIEADEVASWPLEIAAILLVALAGAAATVTARTPRPDATRRGDRRTRTSAAAAARPHRPAT